MRRGRVLLLWPMKDVSPECHGGWRWESELGRGKYLSGRIILLLVLRRNNRPSFISIYQICLRITDHACRAGVHQPFDIRLLTRLNHTLCPIHVDLLVHRIAQLRLALGALANGHRRRCVDDDIWLYLLEDRQNG